MNDRIIASIILEGAATVEDTLVVSEKSSRRVVAEGTLQDLGVENRNRRIYEEADMAPEINGPRMTELIKAREFKGEYGHPLSDDLVRQQTIDPKLVCVQFNKVWLEGNLIKAQFQGTNNNYGEYFDADLRDGHKPAFSLRALGSIENKNGKAYVRGIKIITWDSVIYPSHKAAYTDKIVSESTVDGIPVVENTIVVANDDPGTIINLSASDAKTVINRLQRESANISTITDTFSGIMDKITYIKESNMVMLTSRFGDKFYVNLDNHVENLIMDYVFKM